VTAESRQQFVGNRFIAAGYHPYGAFSPVGNGCQESGPGLDSTFERAHADHGSGGFLEWRDSQGAPRKTRLATFADAHQVDRNDLGIQVDYAIWELGKYFPDLDAQLRNPGVRTIANLTANFCDEYENPAPATAGMNNRIAHAEAAYATWKAHQQAPGPRPAPTPPAPEHPAPAPVPGPPMPAPAPPPISASDAGMEAAILDNIGAMVDALLKKRAEIDRKITVLKTAAEDFGKLPGVAFALPPPLQNTVSGSSGDPKPQPKRTTIVEAQITAAIRNALIFGGGYFVSKGWVDNTTLVSIVGGVMSVGGAAWSAWGHTKTSIIASAADLPDVSKIVTIPAIADSPKFAMNPTVVSH
jgi:hypothetical protein